jgi:hypothetical protein
MRIRIQLLFNLDPDRGFDDQNIGKKCSWQKFTFFIYNCICNLQT